MREQSAFKSPTGEAAYRAAFDDIMSLWPVPYEELEIPSRFGLTHVVTCGAMDAPPLVLLHGFMTSLALWVPNIADLSQDYRLYAIDTIGQPSKSIPAEPVCEAADYVTWLSATLDGLELDRVYLLGQSTGGWIALNFAMGAPQRVRKLALLSPAASFQPLSWQFNMRAILSILIPTRRTMDSLMAWMGVVAIPGDPFTKRLLELIWLGGKNFRMAPETRGAMPAEFADDELRALEVPVLLLIGEGEVLYDPAKALARARELVPDLEGDLVPGCKHDMCYSQHELVDARLLAFLGENGR